MAPPLPHLPSPPREVRHDLPQCPRAMFQVAPRNGTSLGTWVHCNARPRFATRGFVLKISNTIKHLQIFIDYYGLLWFIIDYYIKILYSNRLLSSMIIISHLSPCIAPWSPVRPFSESDFPGLIGSLSQVGGELGQQLLDTLPNKPHGSTMKS